MMLAVSVVVLLSVLNMAAAGDTTPANTLPQSARKTLLQEVQEIKQMLTSKQQAAPCPNPVVASGSSKELWVIKSKLMALETKLDVTHANQKTTQARLEATQMKLEATQTKLKATKAKQDATEQALKSTQATLKTLKANRKGGVAGGSWYGHTGAASNRLCLTMQPQFDSTSAHGTYHALLYGVEYEYIFNHHNHDVPCSVCRAPHSITIMIPATRACPKGWTTQYTGHITAGYYNHNAASQYICLDKDPKNANRGNQNLDGSELYYTITRCGSLPCPPYANKKVVLCVVCSK